MDINPRFKCFFTYNLRDFILAWDKHYQGIRVNLGNWYYYQYVFSDNRDKKFFKMVCGEQIGESGMDVEIIISNVKTQNSKLQLKTKSFNI